MGREGVYLSFESETMNQKNAITSMIPRRLLEYVPSAVRGEWADRIVSKFQENNPELFASMAQWGDIPDDEVAAVQKEIVAAAEQIHQEIIDEK